MLNSIVGLLDAGVAASTNSYESIATANGTGASGVITFSSIPSTYKHLQIRWIDKSTTTGSYNFLRFNSDSGSNYANHYLYGDGASAVSGADTTQTSINLYGSLVTSSASNVYAVHVLDILDYTSVNKNKTIRALGGQDSNGSGIAILTSGLWMNSSTAISSLTITANTGSFTTASSFALYGIKG
ncbi:hypothetical protein UFOVP710_10 [uncultured Caudovirales phage]|uniref:Uncharacterized protein n=1 Tax=uncultured Caudovirales phage TaxID=2100421 RepID=A0A6J5NFQ6_9CAUD|nr:hypothetical protein UFOVP710_10 [uncultured Caudovirales phage]